MDAHNDATILERGSALTATLILNRPAKLNCINWQMMAELESALDRLERDPGLRLLILRGAGERAFCSGGDLKEFRELDRDGAVRWIRLGQRIFDRIERLPAVTLAVLQGYVFGGGLELALACDLRLALPTAVFSSPEMQHGWPPGWGALTRLPRLVGTSRALQLVLTGERLGADLALAQGLVNWVEEPEAAESRIARLSDQLAGTDPSLLAFTKSALRGRSGVDADVLATLAAKG